MNKIRLITKNQCFSFSNFKIETLTLLQVSTIGHNIM